MATPLQSLLASVGLSAPEPARLLENAPSRPRAIAEAGLVLCAVFLPGNLSALGNAPLVAATAVLFLWGLALLRPWNLWRTQGRGQAVSQTLVLTLALAGATASHWLSEPPAPPPRLGIEHARVMTGEGAQAHPVVEVTTVTPGLPAEGRLEVGDRLLAVEGTALSTEDPQGDLQTRIREAGGGKSTDLHLSLERHGERLEVTVPVGPTRRAQPFKSGTMTWLCLRALGMCLLVVLLLRSNGQDLAQLGLVREGWVRELLLGLPVIAGTYAVHIAASLPIAAVATLMKLTGQETLARKEVASALTDMGLSVPAFAAAMVLVTGFEEVTFRGFLVPRLRVVLERWWAAVLLSAALFGLGHVYEGTFAVFQTAVLGAWFGLVFVWRTRLPSVMLAHAAFNTLNFAAMLWLQRSGLLEKLSQQLGH